MIALILLILLLLFFNQEIFHKKEYMQEGFNQGYINPYHLEEYNTSGPDSEYYYDRSGLKGSLFNLPPQLRTPNRIIKPPIEKKDHTNCIVNKLL